MIPPIQDRVSPGGARRASGAPPTTLERLGDDVEQLLRAQGRLARAELRHQLTSAGHALVWLATGALLAMLGVLLLVQAAVLALSTVVSLQAALLAVAIILIAVAVAMIGHGRQGVAKWRLTPRRSLDALRATFHHFKERPK